MPATHPLPRPLSDVPPDVERVLGTDGERVMIAVLYYGEWRDEAEVVAERGALESTPVGWWPLPDARVP